MRTTRSVEDRPAGVAREPASLGAFAAANMELCRAKIRPALHIRSYDMPGAGAPPPNVADEGLRAVRCRRYGVIRARRCKYGVTGLRRCPLFHICSARHL